MNFLQKLKIKPHNIRVKLFKLIQTKNKIVSKAAIKVKIKMNQMID